MNPSIVLSTLLLSAGNQAPTVDEDTCFSQDLDRRSAEACDEICSATPRPAWCGRFCDENRELGLTCHGTYTVSPICPVFEQTTSVAGRAGVDGQFHAWQGGGLEVGVRLGRRILRELQLFVDGSAGLGVRTPGRASIPLQLGLGGEVLWLASNTQGSPIYGTGLTLGYLWTDVHPGANDLTPQGPAISLSLRRLAVSQGGDPRYRTFAGWSIGAAGTVGYDPDLEQVLVRIGLQLGFDLFIR